MRVRWRTSRHSCTRREAAGGRPRACVRACVVLSPRAPLLFADGSCVVRWARRHLRCLQGGHGPAHQRWRQEVMSRRVHDRRGCCAGRRRLSVGGAAASHARSGRGRRVIVWLAMGAGAVVSGRVLSWGGVWGGARSQAGAAAAVCTRTQPSDEACAYVLVCGWLAGSQIERQDLRRTPDRCSRSIEKHTRRPKFAVVPLFMCFKS